MTSTRRFLLGCVAVATLAGCANEPELVLPDLSYEAWTPTTTAALDFPVPGHGAGLRRVFMNDIGWSASPTPARDITYPDGTVVVKEVFATAAPSADALPQALTIMVKDSDSEMARDGWIWLVKDPVTGEETLFADPFCIACHENANEEHPYADGNSQEYFRDYLFHPPIRSE